MQASLNALLGMPEMAIPFIAPERDIRLIGCLTEDELYNGSSFMRARKVVKQKTFLEENNIKPYFDADVYCAALRKYINGVYGGDHGLEDMWHDADAASSFTPPARKSIADLMMGEP